MKKHTVEKFEYEFSELSDEAKQKALENNWDYNVDYNWWESVYEDAEMVGLKINGFDIDRGSYCQLEFVSSVKEVAEKIKSDHRETCETYKDAIQFISDYDELVKKYADASNPDQVSEDNEYEFDNEVEALEEEFKKTLSEDYRIILQKEYEYRTSEESISESIESNGLTFNADGGRFVL